MSVLKSKRKASQFEVFHHLYKMRKEITDLLLRDFGYSVEKQEKKLERRFGGKPAEELDEHDRALCERLRARWDAFDEWFIKDSREHVTHCLREITNEVYIANSIYPEFWPELIERRVHQERAIGWCFALTQELQYAIETLPVDVNQYLRFADSIQTEINLIKGWRKSDNRFKKELKDPPPADLSYLWAISDSATNFANVNNNGNANNNNASNSNGVRPDFTPAERSSLRYDGKCQTRRRLLRELRLQA